MAKLCGIVATFFRARCSKWTSNLLPNTYCKRQEYQQSTADVTRRTFTQSHSGRRNGSSRVSGCSPNFWGTGAVLTHNIKIWSWSPQQWDQGPQNIIQNGQHQCFWCTTAKILLSRLSAAAYGCTLFLLVTFALHELTVSLATEHQNAPELVRKHIPPPGARHQRHLVVYTQNSSGINCTPMSGHFCSRQLQTTCDVPDHIISQI